MKEDGEFDGWTHDPHKLTCVREYCEMPSPPDEGLWFFGCTDEKNHKEGVISSGGMCELKCLPGYERVSPQLIRCERRHWEQFKLNTGDTNGKIIKLPDIKCVKIPEEELSEYEKKKIETFEPPKQIGIPEVNKFAKTTKKPVATTKKTTTVSTEADEEEEVDEEIDFEESESKSSSDKDRDDNDDEEEERKREEKEREEREKEERKREKEEEREKEKELEERRREEKEEEERREKEEREKQERKEEEDRKREEKEREEKQREEDEEREREAEKEQRRQEKEEEERKRKEEKERERDDDWDDDEDDEDDEDEDEESTTTTEEPKIAKPTKEPEVTRADYMDLGSTPEPTEEVFLCFLQALEIQFILL